MLRRLRNETEDDIKTVMKAIERCNTNIDRLHSTKDFNPKVMIERNKAEIIKYEAQLLSLKQKLQQIEDGQYDDILTNELVQNKQNIQTKTDITKRRKVDKIKIKSSPVSSKRNYTKYPTDDYYANKNLKREMDIAERHYFKDVASIPDYLHDKLDNMPNNMGYIWRNIWCFGKNPPQPYFTEYIMYEKNYSQFLVHVLNKRTREYCIYEKDHSGNKRLLEKKRFNILI